MPRPECKAILDSPKGRGYAIEHQQCHEYCTPQPVIEVLKSPAGWYIGAMITDEGITEPMCRMTAYFPTEQEAKDYLTGLIEDYD